jgi:hypothetical protein
MKPETRLLLPDTGLMLKKMESAPSARPVSIGINGGTSGEAFSHLSRFLELSGMNLSLQSQMADALENPRELTSVAMTLINELILRNIVVNQLSYRRAWRYYIEYLAGFASHGVIEDATATLYRIEHHLDSEYASEGGADLPAYSFWRNPTFIVNFINQRWSPSSRPVRFCCFGKFLDWLIRQIARHLPAAVQGLPLLQSNPMHGMRRERSTIPKRAILTMESFFAILDRLMTEPEYEDIRPNAWMNFCRGARPVSEASPGSSAAQAEFNEHHFTRLKDFDLNTPGEYGFGRLNLPINKRHKGMAAARGAHRRAGLLRLDQEYLIPILAPLLEQAKTQQDGMMRRFCTVDGAAYSRRLFALLDEMDPMLRVEGYDGEIPWSVAREIDEIKTSDVIRATRSAFFETYLVDKGLVPAHQSQQAVNHGMGHSQDSPIFEYNYQGLIISDDIAYAENHKVPAFTYDPDHSNRKAFRESEWRAVILKANVAYRQKLKDPDFAAYCARRKNEGRQRNAAGKVIVPAASLANLTHVVSPQCREAANASYAKLAADHEWRRQLSIKQNAARKRGPNGKIIASAGSLAAMERANARKKAEASLVTGTHGIPFANVPDECTRHCFAPPVI